ncbi:16S rRNA (guanine(966)-N(2))-methyltransferase RsmD [bacterium]|nr:16S rRNA (guanine(966)-N(2))-methyltransferase RsmD [bacterium]
MTVRIISGNRRGAHLDTPEGMATRPLRDRVRQALFNILRPHTREAVVYDAFAGSGAVGLEALSNGARSAVFVDMSREATAVIRRNVTKLRFEKQSTILEGPSPAILASLDKKHPPFTLLFLMPPYHSGLCIPVLESLELQRRCDHGCLAVCEIHEDESIPPIEGWLPGEERQYGITRLLFLTRNS